MNARERRTQRRALKNVANFYTRRAATCSLQVRDLDKIVAITRTETRPGYCNARWQKQHEAVMQIFRRSTLR